MANRPVESVASLDGFPEQLANPKSKENADAKAVASGVVLGR